MEIELTLNIDKSVVHLHFGACIFNKYALVRLGFHTIVQSHFRFQTKQAFCGGPSFCLLFTVSYSLKEPLQHLLI